MATQRFDIVVAGGGLTGASLGGVLARSGRGVLVVEKERVFRDRIRGELTWPWGHHEALRAGLGEALVQAGAVNRPALDFYADGQRVDSVRWADVSIDALPAIAFSHPRLQEALLTWAESQGAIVMRPAKVGAVQDGHRPSVTVVQNGRITEVQARLIVGADGKKSSARRWLLADTLTDPEHHWFGGLLLSGVPCDDNFGWATTPAAAVGWFATSSDSCRVYVRLRADQARAAGIAHSVDKFMDFAAEYMPPGTLHGARAAGPLGFFSNSCTWSSRIALGHAVLVGDAAGALDPTQGLVHLAAVPRPQRAAGRQRQLGAGHHRVRKTAARVLPGAPRVRPLVRAPGCGRRTRGRPPSQPQCRRPRAGPHPRRLRNP